MIKLIVTKLLGTMQLGDVLVSFAAEHPNIALSVLLEDSSFRAQDFVERGYDLALRWGSGRNLRDSTLVSAQLGTLPRTLCATPRYFAGRKHPAKPTDLEQVDCLVHNLAAKDNIWRFIDGDQEVGVKVRGAFA